ncbi:MAG: glycosyltransferase family 39 protein [Deltaproteobacteria bacterium]|nr:glycosyltransferase family 39 protein [Deltaproteobacteria bacterium]
MLVAQLGEGNGYTLKGTPLIDQGILDEQQYGRELFFHPPGGVGLFWLFYSVFGQPGFAMAQMFSYALFFWSMVAAAFFLRLPPLGVMLAGLLSALNPIAVHVGTHYWLDGPLLALCVLSLAVFIKALQNRSVFGAVAAGFVLGLASLIKITAFLVMPGFALLALVLLERPKLKLFIGLSACLFATALLVQLPWEIWQWMVFGTPFPGWAGKPSQALIESNQYVRYLTVVRQPWIYLTLLPKVMWAIVPALVFYVLTLKDPKARGVGAAFILWIATVLVFHVVLGARGYSKVLRYVILAAPPAILLFSMTVPLILTRFREGVGNARRLYGALLIVAALAVLLEAAAGVKSTALYAIDLIFPLFGGL